MSTSLDRKLEAVAKRIEEERRQAKPLTEQQFEKGDHLKSGAVIPPMPDFWYSFHPLTPIYLQRIQQESDRISAFFQRSQFDWGNT